MRTLIIFLTIFYSYTSFSQDPSHLLRGRVYELNEEGKKMPLEYANVYWLINSEGVISNENGEFTIHKPHVEDDQLKLIVSYVGYNPDTINVSRMSKDIEIVLESSRQLDEVLITKRTGTSVTSKIQLIPTQVITEAGLQKLACCNIGESFESNATVDVGFTDAVSGAKKIKMLGLDGMYSQLMFENIPFMRGMEAGYGLGHIPGPFMNSIQISKGTSSVINGYESTTGQINVEYKKPFDSEPFFLNLFANTEGRYESNITSAIKINEQLSTMLFFHASTNTMALDHNKDGFMDTPLGRQYNFLNRWEYVIMESIHAQLGIELLDETKLGGELDFKGRDENGNGLYGIDISLQKMRLFGKLGYVFPNNPANSIGWINSFTVFDQQSYFGNRNHQGNQKSIYSNLIFQTQLFNPYHSLSSGLSFTSDTYREDFLSENFDRSENVAGIFTQYTFAIPGRIVVMGGMRADHNNLHGMLYTPRFHVKYDPTSHYTIRGTLGKAHRSANVFSENLSLLASSRSFEFDNNFEIESAWNAGISLSRYFHLKDQREAVLTIDFFRTEFQNQIVVDRDFDVNKIYFYNLNGKSYSNSFQTELSGELFKGFDLSLAYRFNDVKTEQLSGLKEKPFVYRHKGLFTTTWSAPYDKWKYDITIQYNGSSRIPDTFTNPEEFRMQERSPGFFMVHSQLTRKFRKFDIYIGAENLTGFRQEKAIIGANDPFGSSFDATMVWGPLTGRMFYGGIRLAL
jgi:outer membrane receptor for ferrienterochelin and colicins